MDRLDAIPVTFESWVECAEVLYTEQSVCKFRSVKPITFANRMVFMFLTCGKGSGIEVKIHVIPLLQVCF